MAEEKEKEVKKVSKTPKKETKTTKKVDTKKDTKKETKTTKSTTTKTTKKTSKNKKEEKVENKEVKTTKKVDKKEAKKVEKKVVVQANAILKYERIAPSKVNIVARLIRDKDIDEALSILRFTNKAASPILIKLLNSAIANAENNHSMNRNKLYVSEIYVNAGPILKRMRPRARGSGFRINKRTSHIEIVLREREEK